MLQTLKKTYRIKLLVIDAQPNIFYKNMSSKNKTCSIL